MAFRFGFLAGALDLFPFPLGFIPIIGLRYFVATMMVSYGVAKIVEGGQFPTPWVGRYDQSYGESSPMGLLWTFMGHSQPYAMFGGLAETAGGLLLLFR